MNPMKMMKQFQQKQQQLMAELEELRVSASSGGDMVTVTMNGKKEVQSIKLDPEAVDPQDVEMLQDLLVAAMRECGRKVDESMESKVSGLTAGLPIPGL